MHSVMEQAKYWMLARRKLGDKPLLGFPIQRMASATASYNESWEEQAFAEDFASQFMWPPRSYSCSFCGREFRSAQALGGHMNVHRRDRARMKQSSSLTSEEQDSDKVCTPVSKQYRQLQVGNSLVHKAISSPPSRVSSQSMHEDGDHTLVSPSSCTSCVIADNQIESIFPTNQPIASSTSIQQFAIPDLNLVKDKVKSRDQADDEEDIRGKRRRIDLMMRINSIPTEELDLELRLGYGARLE